MKSNETLMVAALCAALGLVTHPALAQNEGETRQQRERTAGEPPPAERGPRNFDPAEMQKRIVERHQENLEITDAAEWKVVEPMIQKVVEARMQTLSGMGRGMFGGRGNRGGGFGPPSPDADALQKVIDAKASNAEIKSALARYVEARKAKQAALEKAQEELRKVLTPRQEAIAALSGLL
jgi:hypothetical protein